VGTRKLVQLYDNLGSVGWKISDDDLAVIDNILVERLSRVEKAEEKL
jgi:aryl-alcohol dehydrogenase-like predicted oxidoreductase